MTRKKLINILVCGILIIVSTELSSRLGLFYLRHFRGIEYSPLSVHINERERDFFDRFLTGELENKLYIFDSDLGWTIAPDISMEEENDHYSITTNSLGVRSLREYSIEPSRDKTRIASFGCSFTFCIDIGDKETWPYYLEKSMPNLEVLNYGVPGYGLDQAYLRYKKEGKKTSPDIVLVGISPDTVRRNVNIYRVWLLQNIRKDVGGWWLKPRFTIKNGGIHLIENPCKQKEDYKKVYDGSFLADIGKNDFFFKKRGYVRGPFDFLACSRLLRLLKVSYHEKDFYEGGLRDDIYDRELFARHKSFIFNKRFEGYRILEELCDEFYKAIKLNNAEPVFIILPERGDFLDHKGRRPRRYMPLLTYLKQKGYNYLDILGYLPDEYKVDDLCEAHYTAKGNAFVALIIKTYLSQKGILAMKEEGS